MSTGVHTHCVGSCGLHGVCDEVHGRCNCQLGWGGPTCGKLRQPGCSLGSQDAAGPQLRVPCAGVRAVSPVACDCLQECLSSGEDVCGHASVGCNDKWKTRPANHRSSMAYNLTYKPTFYALLTCIALPPGERATSAYPPPRGARLTTFADYREHGYPSLGAPVPINGAIPAYGAGLSPPEDWRGGGIEPKYATGAVWVWGRGNGSQARCVSFEGMPWMRVGCSGRGRCLLERGGGGLGRARCVCVDGSYGAHCEQVCSNDCLNDCSGNGACIHGFCKCDVGWFGVDCSDSLEPSRAQIPRGMLHFDASAYGPGPVGMAPERTLSELPRSIRPHVRRMRKAVFVYDLPPSINREADRWSMRFWNEGCFVECDPVHKRRIYATQAHFDGHLMHDDYIRTLDPSQAKLFYVPTFMMQRHTWAGAIQRTMLSVYNHLRFAYPYWNRTGGRDHVWFMPGEKLNCVVPEVISDHSIIVTHWGGRKGYTSAETDCLDPAKDVVVPPITPIQHDLAEYRRRLQGPMNAASGKNVETVAARSGPLLLFAGGIASFGASQERKRKGGVDTRSKQEHLMEVVGDTKKQCSEPSETKNKRCRMIYSMGVRQSVWRARLWADPDMKIVSSGIPNYLAVASTARFCLHTEGNSWGTRLIDQMAVECLPLIVNDGMVFPFENLLTRDAYNTFSLHLSKTQIPQIPAILRNVSDARRLEMHRRLREYKRGFVWFRPEGLAYEYTIAALGERLVSWLGETPETSQAGGRRARLRVRRRARGGEKTRRTRREDAAGPVPAGMPR